MLNQHSTFTFDIQQSTVNSQQSAVRIPHSAFRIPHSAFRIPHSAFRIRHAAFSIRHSAIAFAIRHSTLGNEMLLSIRVIPRSARTGFAGWRGDAVLVRLAAPPVENAANEALVEFLARAFDRPRRDIDIVSGQKSRDKRIRIGGLSDAEISARLSAMLKPGPPDDSR